MINIAELSINTFGHNGLVPTSEQVYVLSSSQLKEIIQEAVERATEPLIARLELLEESTTKERAYDRQRIRDLENKRCSPLQQDRSLVLKSLIAAYGGKMLEKEARQKMHLSKQLFTNLLASIDDNLLILQE
jgi:hypothetical protein